MLDTFGFPTPQGSNYQEFYGGGTTRDWLKPRGASMVRMLLIGAGAGGRAGSTSAGGTGGGSGAVTEWIGPAIFIPDELRISIGAGGASAAAGGDTSIIWQGPTASAGYTLLTASGAASNTAGTAFTNNFFGASGIFKSTAGQAGAAVTTAITASTTIFLSGGGGGSSVTTTAGGNVACNYGYPTISGGAGTTGGNGADGFFLTQPIMIGVGGAGGGGKNTTGAGGNGGNGGIGCGGGGGGRGTTSGASLGGQGGDGAVFIWSW
jgi:hypothetical protein